MVNPAEVAQTAETEVSILRSCFEQVFGTQANAAKTKSISQTEAGVEVYLLQQVRELRPDARFG